MLVSTSWEIWFQREEPCPAVISPSRNKNRQGSSLQCKLISLGLLALQCAFVFVILYFVLFKTSLYVCCTTLQTCLHLTRLCTPHPVRYVLELFVLLSCYEALQLPSLMFCPVRVFVCACGLASQEQLCSQDDDDEKNEKHIRHSRLPDLKYTSFVSVLVLVNFPQQFSIYMYT